MWLRIKVVFCFLPWHMFCRLSCVFFWAMKKGNDFWTTIIFFCKSKQVFKILQVSGVPVCFRWLFPQHYTHKRHQENRRDGHAACGIGGFCKNHLQGLIFHCHVMSLEGSVSFIHFRSTIPKIKIWPVGKKRQHKSHKLRRQYPRKVAGPICRETQHPKIKVGWVARVGERWRLRALHSQKARPVVCVKSIQCSRWSMVHWPSCGLITMEHGFPSIWIRFERMHQFWVPERPLWKCKLVKVRFFMVSVGYDTLSENQGVFTTILSSVSLHLFSFWQPWKFGECIPKHDTRY